MKAVKELMGLEEADKMKGEDPCWPNYEMIGTKPGKDGRPVPNCVLKKPKKAKPKNEEVELDEEQHSVLFKMKKDAPKISVAHYKSKEDAHKFLQSVKDKGGNGIIRSKTNEEVELEEAKVGDTVSFHHELKSAPGSKVKKSGTVEKVDGDVVHVKVKDKYGVKRHQIKMGDLVKEDTEQIDELNKDTVYSYNKKADADIEKKHKSLGQLMRRGDAAGANKAAHQINRRLAGMERAEKRLNTEEVEVEESKKIPASDKPVDPKDLVVSLKDVPVKKPRGYGKYKPEQDFPGVKALKREEVEVDEGLLDAAKSAVKTGAKHIAGAAKSTAVGFVHGAIDAATSDSAVLKHVGKKLHNVVKKKFGEEVELDEAVEVRHDRYQRSHGKNASGTGDWMFTHKSSGQVNYSNDKEIHRARGSFSDAAKSAKAWAKSHGHTSVYVMEQTERQIDELSNKFLSDYKTASGKQASELDKQGTKKATIKANKRFRGINRATKKQFANDAKNRNEEVELDESTKLLAKHGDVEVHSMGSSVLSVLKKGKEIAQGDYDRHADTYWISHPSFGKGDKAFDTTMDVAKHFSSVKEEVDLNEEAPPIHVRSSYTQAYAKHHKTGKKPSDAVAAAYEDVAKKHGYDMVKKLKAHHAANEQVETAAQVTKHFEMGQSTPTGVPKWVAKVVKAKKKLQKEQADSELMGAQPSGNKKLAAKFEKSFKAMGQPRKVNCMTVGQVSSCEDTEHEFNAMFTEAMKKKPEASSKQTLKKGEKLSGKQEPVTISPEIEKKGVA